MNDRTLPPELARAAALDRIVRAKTRFTQSAVSVLRGDEGAAEQADAAMAELAEARVALKALDRDASDG